MIAPTAMQGFYRVTVHRADGSERYRSHWMPNLITNIGLDRIGTDWFLGRCYVGSGNTAPTTFDVELETLVASTDHADNTTAGALSEAPYAGTYDRDFRFAQGAVSGNITEVGVGWASNELFSRALFVDAAGDPTAITVLADEILTVSYRLYNYAPEADTQFTLLFADGASHIVTARAAMVTDGSVRDGWGVKADKATGYRAYAYADVMGEVTGAPSGSSDYVGLSVGSYTAGSHQLEFVASWGLDQANWTEGIKSLFIRTDGLGAYQFDVDPPIMKTSDHVLNLTFRVSWGRHE